MRRLNNVSRVHIRNAQHRGQALREQRNKNLIRRFSMKSLANDAIHM